MAKPHVVVVGHVTIDHNKTERTSYVSWGGPAMYMAKYCERQFGIAPTIVTRRGTDYAKYDTDIHFAPATPTETHTLVYENIVSNGHRTQRCHFIAEAAPPVITADVRATLAAADILIVATLLPNYSPAYIAEMLSIAPSHCLKVLSPQGYFRHVTNDGTVSLREFHEATELLPLFDMAVYSDEDYPDALAATRAWSAHAPQTALFVTQSENGVSIVQHARMQAIPTVAVPPTEMVDSVGCGDVFTIAAALDFWKTHDVRLAAMAGNTAARNKLLARHA